MYVRLPSCHFPKRKLDRIRNLAPAPCGLNLSLYWVLPGVPSLHLFHLELQVSGEYLTCVPTPTHTHTFKGFILRGGGVTWKPPISLFFYHSPLYLDLTIASCGHLCLHLPMPPGPHALFSYLLSLLCHLSSLLGLWPRRLSGHPPWLPLCGSELAPPPTPPPARPLIRLWTQRLGVRHKAPGAKDRSQPLSTHRGAPCRGHGGGPPHQVCPSTQRPWAGVPHLRAIIPPILLAWT